MAEAGSSPEPTFEAAAARLLRDVVAVLVEYAEAGLAKPSYMLTDADYARHAKVSELSDLVRGLDRFL